MLGAKQVPVTVGASGEVTVTITLTKADAGRRP